MNPMQHTPPQAASQTSHQPQPTTTAKRGYLITLEGVEGAGKSTALRYLCQQLREAGIDHITSREPGGTTVAEEIRHLVLDPRDEILCPEAELLLFFAARKQNIDGIIKPALARGQWVICDRFTDASFAYQGGGRGMPESALRFLKNWIQADTIPDLTFLLDVPWHVTERRLRPRHSKDRIEQEPEAFFARVRTAYLRLAQEEPERIRVIDASQTLINVRRQMDQYLRPLIEQKVVG